VISEGAFRRPWAAHLAWYFRGATPSETEDIWNYVTQEFLATHWREDILKLVNQHKRSNDLVMLVSAGPEPLIAHIAKVVGADIGIGTELEIKDGKYSGKSLHPVCINEYKAQKVKTTLQKYRLTVDLTASSAYADSISDQQLLELAGHPVAVYPDQALRKLATQNSWQFLPNYPIA
jgi:HAD superfamily hydrolase (TIGR01490 family)